MKQNPVLWLRISYWVGAIIDILAGLIMLFPGLFTKLMEIREFLGINTEV